jgi:hypothetical protein
MDNAKNVGYIPEWVCFSGNMVFFVYSFKKERTCINIEMAFIHLNISH